MTQTILRIDQPAPVARFADLRARQFVEMLAVPQPSAPPPCPLCGHRHTLEQRCSR
jgi:hypothetical protein